MQVAVDNGCAVVSEIGRFDHVAADEFAARVTCLVGAELPKYVIVDLSGNKGVFSAAIVELVCLEDVLRSKNGLLVLCGLSEDAKAALAAANLHHFFLIAADVQKARELLEREKEI